MVVVNAASPVDMAWADDVGAILQCWFAGEEWGHALADVLSGDANASGKLPTTIPFRLEDTPAFTNYPGERGQVRYGEGVFVGYRWYDARDIAPRFCFGHGLSYTTFALDAPSAERAEVTVAGLEAGEKIRVVVPVRNTGARRGAEVVQCYVRDVDASVSLSAPRAQGVRQVVARSRRRGGGDPRARPALLRVLGRDHARLDG